MRKPFWRFDKALLFDVLPEKNLSYDGLTCFKVSPIIFYYQISVFVTSIDIPSYIYNGLTSGP